MNCLSWILYGVIFVILYLYITWIIDEKNGSNGGDG